MIQNKYVKANYSMNRITTFSLEANELCEYGEAYFNCLIVISTGSLNCSYIDGSLLNKGDSMLLACSHSFRLTSGAYGASGYIIEFQVLGDAKETQLNDELTPIYGKPARIKPFNQLILQLNNMYKHIDISSAKIQIENHSTFLSILIRMLDVLSTNCEIGDARSNVQQSIDYIHAFYMTKFKVEQLAQNANVSVRQYLRIFKTITGVTPVLYMNQYRIYRAQELLLLKDESIQSIASEVGFEDVNYFNRLFKQKVGCTPKEYIRLKHSHPRIVSLHYTGELLALGIVPIADLNTTLRQICALPQNIKSVGETTCDIEKLKELDPDIVILSDSIEQDIKEKIEKFVPIIVIPWDIDPIVRLQQVAKITGKTQEATQYISNYEHSCRSMKDWCVRQHFEPKSTAVLRLDEGRVWIHAARFFPLFFEIMPFQPSKLMLETTESDRAVKRYDIPFSQLFSLESDRLYIVIGYETDFNNWLSDLVRLDEWKQLEAVKHDEVYLLRHEGITNNNLYNLQKQIDECPVIMSGEIPTHYEGILVGKLSSFLN